MQANNRVVSSDGELVTSNKSEVINVTGLCRDDGKYVNCHVTNIPKYYRQIIDTVSEPRNAMADSLNEFTFLDHTSTGYFVPNRIGYKYRSGAGLPGIARKASRIEDFDVNATVFEIRSHEANTNLETILKLVKTSNSFFLTPSCKISSFIRTQRNDEQVLVIEFLGNIAPEQTLECSVAGHLRYFGLNLDSASEYKQYYQASDNFRNKVKFDMEKIIRDLN